MMKRTNRVRLRPVKEQEKILFSLCEMSAVLWNKLNYIRRQAFFEGRFDWKEGVEELYNEFKRILGSATAQQIIRKNNASWRRFFSLLRLKRLGKLPPHIRKVSPPRYWKDRLTGRRNLMTVIRNDCYMIEEVGRRKYLVLLNGLRVRITGENFGSWIETVEDLREFAQRLGELYHEKKYKDAIDELERLLPPTPESNIICFCPQILNLS